MKEKPNAQYFLWAVVMETIVLYPLILTADIWVIVFQGFNERHARVFCYYIIFLTIMIIMPIFDIICVLLLWFVTSEIFKEDFPIPHPPCSCSCLNRRGPIFIQIAAVIIFTLCFQHLSFHGLYILLGFAASPLQATSLLAFYSTAAFCMVSFFAVVLKVIDIDIKTIKEWRVKTCVKQLVPLLMVVLFVGFVSCVIAYYVQAAMIVEEYRNGGGITSFVGSLAPSMMLSLLGFVGKKFVDMTKSKNTKSANGGESSSNVETKRKEELENPLLVKSIDADAGSCSKYGTLHIVTKL